MVCSLPPVTFATRDARYTDEKVTLRKELPRRGRKKAQTEPDRGKDEKMRG